VIKAVSYLRISSPGAVDGDGFPRQRAAVEKYAREHDVEIVEEFRDEGVPGKTELQNRAGLAACLARVEGNGVKLVLVEIADRLARDSMIAEMIIREFQKAGVRVISASGGIDLTAGDDNNPTAKLVRQILAAVAEFDRCVIVLKTRAARERIRASGKRCEGRKQYGDRPGEPPVLRIMRELRQDGMSPSRIARHLNLIGAKTRQEGKRWHGATVNKILRQKTLTESLQVGG
jgi:DNA invertase Pin-like site-specific DNA recombinase